jgi:hypothetical protein
MAASPSVAAILRDASRRDAPQDEVTIRFAAFAPRLEDFIPTEAKQLQIPLNCGGRLVLKASTPSLKSSDWRSRL